MHDFAAAAGHFEHFVEADLVEFFGGGDYAGVAGIDAVHVGKDLAEVGLHGGCDGDGGEVAAAAPEGGDALVFGLALEAGDDADIALGEVLFELLGGEVGDFGAGVDAVGDDAGLCAGEGDGFFAHGVNASL